MRIGLGDSQCVLTDANGNCTVASDVETGDVQTTQASLPLFSSYPSQLSPSLPAVTSMAQPTVFSTFQNALSSNSSWLIPLATLGGLFLALMGKKR